jgi:glycosyltransferase involved in cell wall biosynthesis
MISGAAIVVQQLAQGLAADGHEVLVLAASDRAKAYLQEVGQFRVLRLPAIHNPLRVNQRFLLAPLRTMRRVLAEFQPEMIHMHDPLSLGLCGLKIAREMQAPTILTLHQLPWFPAMYLPPWPGLREGVTDALWWYGSWLIRQCTAVTVPSITIAHIVEEHTGVNPTHIYNGLDLHNFNPQTAVPDEAEKLRQKYGLAPHSPVVLHVGRLDKDKRVDVVLRAFAQAPGDAQMLVVGDGRCRQELIQLSQQLGIELRCVFPGFVCTEGDLPGLYRLSTVFVTASEIETFGLVVHEAMASARPIVTVAAACMPEMVEHGIQGYLAPPGDCAGLAAHITWLLQHPEEAARMGQAGRDRAAKYGLEQIVYEYEQLYGEVVRSFRSRERLILG